MVQGSVHFSCPLGERRLADGEEDYWLQPRRDRDTTLEIQQPDRQQGKCHGAQRHLHRETGALRAAGSPQALFRSLHQPAAGSRRQGQGLNRRRQRAPDAALEHRPLAKLTQEVDILLFVAPGCSVCPHQVKAVAALTLASPLIAAEIVDVMSEPALAQQYDVRAVPTTVVNDELVVVGAKHPLQMAELILWISLSACSPSGVTR